MPVGRVKPIYTRGIASPESWEPYDLWISPLFSFNNWDSESVFEFWTDWPYSVDFRSCLWHCVMNLVDKQWFGAIFTTTSALSRYAVQRYWSLGVDSVWMPQLDVFPVKYQNWVLCFHWQAICLIIITDRSDRLSFIEKNKYTLLK